MPKNLAILALLITSCTASRPEPDSNFAEPVEVVEEESKPILEQEGLPIRDVLEEGFCYDDIYATHLRKEYLARQEQDIRKVRSSRRRRSLRKSADNKSLFHARSKLVGPLSPYFGALPVVSNDQVEFWMQYFKTRGRRTFIKWLVRAESYRSVLAPTLRKEEMPPEFFFLAMIESGFSNTAYSRKAATGTWQFMKGTARIYDLKINHWVDERRDPVKSTFAAARYLRDLYVQFGDWYLAMAAYNAGPGKIRSAIRRAKTRDFWKISKTRYIRNETKHYVPKMLAALNLSMNARRHGFDIKPNPDDYTPLASVKVSRPVYVSEVAKELNVPLKVLKRWNPEIVRGITPPVRKDDYSLRLHASLVDRYYQIENNLSEIEVTDVLMHKIRSGDTLSQIARKYRVKIGQIRAINPRLRARTLRIGRRIAIPIPGIVSKVKRAKTKSKKDIG